MFDVFCSACSSRRLVFPGQVLGLVNSPDGIAVQYRCWCGEIGVWTTGRKSPAAVPLAA